MSGGNLQAAWNLFVAGRFPFKKRIRLWSKDHGRPIFAKIMCRDRFQELNSFLRFDGKDAREEHRKNDNLAPFREIWNMFIS